jgi:DNA-directed RNA polymerase specialized sigma24 family protein
VTEIDRLWAEACNGDQRAFGDWAGRVERPVQRSLLPFARSTDTEGVAQETLMRMWHLSQEDGGRLVGENASLRYAIGIAYNVARNMARKHKHQHLVPLGHLPENGEGSHHDPPSDPFLRDILKRCLDTLKGPLRRALGTRLEHGHRHQDEQAKLVGMTRNTFHQNVTRARKYFYDCLRRHDVHEHEALR